MFGIAERRGVNSLPTRPKQLSYGVAYARSQTGRIEKQTEGAGKCVREQRSARCVWQIADWLVATIQVIQYHLILIDHQTLHRALEELLKH